MGDKRQLGFTLIEMSIVLIIIGLIIGGVLVGQDLIRAAYIRAQITQIERFNTAVNTFYGKYQALPGDMNAQVAQQYGFAARGPDPGEGDGDGIITGTADCGVLEGAGETAMFWRDLSSSQAGGLIEGSFPAADPVTAPADISITAMDLYFPRAKLGAGNYIFVWSGGWQVDLPLGDCSLPDHNNGDGQNYYGLQVIPEVLAQAITNSSANIPVATAYKIDSKVDDGFPQTGRVLALYYYPPQIMWAYGAPGVQGGNDNYGPVVAGDGIATPGTNLTCYDNDNVPGANEHYSTEINQGAGGNCALSFRFQ